jgi:hypothetical protein
MRPCQLHLFPPVRRTSQGRELEQAARASGCSVTVGDSGCLGALLVHAHPQGWEGRWNDIPLSYLHEPATGVDVVSVAGQRLELWPCSRQRNIRLPLQVPP